MSNQGSIATTLGNLTVLLDRIASPEIGATIYGISNPHIAAMATGLPKAVDHLRSELGDSTFDEFAARGQAMEFGDAMHYARHHVQDASDNSRIDDLEVVRPRWKSSATRTWPGCGRLGALSI